MNERVIELSLDLNCKTSGPVVHLTQFDKGVSIHLSAYLDGTFFSLSGTTVVLKGIDARKGQVLLECQVNADGTATATTLDSTFSEDGVAVCKFVISDTTKTYATQTFLVDVDDSLDAEIHDDRYSLLGKLIREILLMDEHGGILVDEELDPTSNHPVQNKVICEVLSHLVEYVTGKPIENATVAGKIYATAVNGQRCLILPVENGTNLTQFRFDWLGKIYVRRRDNATSAFTDWTDLSAATNRSQVFIGDTEPSDPNIELWVDTSGGEPTPGATNPVTNLTGTATTNSVTLSWQASSNATSYIIYQGNNLIDSTASTSYTVSGLTAGSTYTFGVVATGAGGDSTKVTVTLTTRAGGDGRLPAEYQEVEYVQPVGIANQINTGIEISIIAKIEMGLYNDYSKIMKITGAAANDSWAITSDEPYICTQPAQPGNPLKSIGYDSFSMTPESSEYLNLTKYVDFVFNVTSNSTRYFTFGNELQANWNTGDAKYYYVKLYNSSNILIANYVPCYRKSDNKVGMYDLVNETFFLPVHGNFEKGGDV